MKTILLLVVGIFSFNVEASLPEQAPAKAEAYNYAVTISPHLPEGTQNIIQSALSMVALTLKDKMIFSQNTNVEYDFVITVSDRATILSQAQFGPLEAEFLKTLSGDAYTFILPTVSNSPAILRVLFEEAAFQVKDGVYVERKDTFARVITLLGHEIFGNVKNMLAYRSTVESDEFLKNSVFRYEEYLKAEVRAFQAGVEFVEMFLEKHRAGLNAKLIEDFENALLREKYLLKSHTQNLHNFYIKNAKSNNSCHTFFN